MKKLQKKSQTKKYKKIYENYADYLKNDKKKLANGKNIEPTMKIVIEARENELEKVNYSEKKERKRLNEESKKTTKKPAKGRKKK